MANNSSVFDSIDVIGDSVITGSLTISSKLIISGAITGSGTLDLPAKVEYLQMSSNPTTLTNISTPSLFDVSNGNITVYPINSGFGLRFGFAAQGYFESFKCDIFNSGTTISAVSGNTRTLQIQVTPPNDGGANFKCTAYGYNGTTFVYVYSSQAVGVTWTPSFYLKPGARATLIMNYPNREILIQADGAQPTA